MKYIYEVNEKFGVIKRTDENGAISSVPMSLDNSDYQEYLKSLENEANTL